VTERPNSQDDPVGGDFAPQSRLYLSKLASPPATILAHLIEHFSQIPRRAWVERVERGVVTLEDGIPITAETPYRHGMFVLYRKEVAFEPEVVEGEVILYEDQNILVADKPHRMVVTPAGDHVERSLLVRLGRRTGNRALAPVHRLDRETAGVVLFAVNPAVRGAYHELFATGVVEREYLAVASIVDSGGGQHWLVENRMGAGTPWFRRQIVDGPVNAVTEIDLLESRDDIGLFRIRPRTGKKHQIRVHMASIGCPIIGDPLYPEIQSEPDPSIPLQLLAKRLTFVDPLSSESRSFVSMRELRWTKGD
jgi:tRNA pseudouridine32 synthase/23S rRNA pseudouridine746 synthase